MVTASIKSLVDNITKELVVPKIKQFCERLSLEYDKKLIPTAEHFTEYMLRAYEKYSTCKYVGIAKSDKTVKKHICSFNFRKSGKCREYGTYKTMWIPKRVFPEEQETSNNGYCWYG